MEDNTLTNGYMDQFDFLFDEDFDIHQSISSESYNTPQQQQQQQQQQQNNLSPSICASPPIETSFDHTSGVGQYESRPTKQLKTSSWKSSSTSSTSMIISFDSKVVKPKHESDENMNVLQSSFTDRNKKQYCATTTNGHQEIRTKRVATSRTPLHAMDHVIAERKRREKLSQRFIALSSIIPGLKKTDKASILEDAMNYLKEMQERVKTLEEQATNNKMVESTVFVKKSHVSDDNGSSFSSDDETTTFDSHRQTITKSSLPEIEVRIQEKDVLIRIQCEKTKGCTVKLLNEIEKLHLTVVSTSVLPFGSFTLDSTVIAKPGTIGEYVVADGTPTSVGWENATRPSSSSEWATMQISSKFIQPPATFQYEARPKPTTKTKQATKSKSPSQAKSATTSKSKTKQKSTTTSKSKPPASSKPPTKSLANPKPPTKSTAKSLAPPPLPRAHVGFQRSGILCIPGRQDSMTASQLKDEARDKGKGKGKVKTTPKGYWK